MYLYLGHAGDMYMYTYMYIHCKVPFSPLQQYEKLRGMHTCPTESATSSIRATYHLAQTWPPS